VPRSRRATAPRRKRTHAYIGSGDRIMPSEIELKLTTNPESLAKVREHPAVAVLLRGHVRRTEDVSTYYDTAAGELRKAGVALRMRRSGQRWLQTVKGAGERVGALHRRPEYEWSMPTSRIDAGKLSTTPWHDVFEATAGRLRPVFVTDVDRTALPLAFADGTRATLCLDAGEIRSGRKRATLNEIEIELVEGEPGVRACAVPGGGPAGGHGAGEQSRARLRIGTPSADQASARAKAVARAGRFGWQCARPGRR